MKVLIAGLGNMGFSHALAHHNHPDSEIVGIVKRSPGRDARLDYPVHTDFKKALAETRPDLAVIATYTDTHADFAIAAMEAGAHVFVEKPLALTVADAKRVVDVARRRKRKLVVGYILHHHPSWMRLIDEACKLGGPFVFRLNLNQQSQGATWEVHKALMQTTSPIVDCGVHYVDVMCRIAQSKPVQVTGIGLRLSDEIAKDMYNYGQLQVRFADGSVGWYEAGWGPMMSETAYFVKDIISPQGAVSIVDSGGGDSGGGDSDSVDEHTRVGALLVHRIGQDDKTIQLPDEPGHQQLCDAEQAYMLRAIKEDINLDKHMQEAIDSLAICLAADESIRTGKTIKLGDKQ